MTDFGLSKIESTYSSLTGSSIRGSIRWMAPELLLPMEHGGDGRHTTSTDIYAFSMTCIEVFCLISFVFTYCSAFLLLGFH